MRTQLSVLVDRIIRTPFELINGIKMSDLWINKLFIGVINFYLKLLDSSKKYLPLIDSDNKMAKQLLLSMFQFSLMTKMIIGSHKTSKSFFQDQTNLTIKTDGFIDCLVMSDNGILPFRIFFKNLGAVSIRKLDKKMIESVFQVLQLFLDLCERSKGKLFQSKFLPQTKIVLDEIINFLKVFSGFDKENLKYLKFKVQIINRLQTLQLKLKPKKTSLLRNQIFAQVKQSKENPKQVKNEGSTGEIQELKSRVKKLEDLLGNFTTDQNQTQQYQITQAPLLKGVRNLGEQQFLASLDWALNCGDLQICKKLVNWRQNLLKLGRIGGWQMALQVGMKTMKTAKITHSDIINANIQILQKGNQNQLKQRPKQRFLSPLNQTNKNIQANKYQPQKE